MKHVFEFSINKDVQAVQTASFEVPSCYPAISICHNIPNRLALVVNIVIEDSRNRVRFQKQLGYSESLIGLGAHNEETTIGGIPGVIESGIWTVKIYVATEYVRKYMPEGTVNFVLIITDGAAKITEYLGEEVWSDPDFAYTGYDYEKVYKCGRSWYKGDFHAHTRLSDGKDSPECVMEKAHLMNLDFYTATEHNVMHTGWPKTDVLVLPGVEITTPFGHANLFGLRERPAFIENVMRADSGEEFFKVWDNIAHWCEEKEVLFSINHPFLYLWKWEYMQLPLNKVSCLEIVNDPTYEAVEKAHAKEANQLAIRMSDLLWADGYRICAIGGSDSHNHLNEYYDGATEPSIAGDPATWLPMEWLSAQNISDHLKKCRACVTRYVDALELELYADDKRLFPGDRMDERVRSVRWQIMLKSNRCVPYLFAWINGKRVELSLHTEDGACYMGAGELELPEEEYSWIRFGAESERGGFMMYANPVTRGTRQHELIMFGDVKDRLGI